MVYMKRKQRLTAPQNFRRLAKALRHAGAAVEAGRRICCRQMGMHMVRCSQVVDLPGYVSMMQAIAVASLLSNAA